MTADLYVMWARPSYSHDLYVEAVFVDRKLSRVTLHNTQREDPQGEYWLTIVEVKSTDNVILPGTTEVRSKLL